MLFADAGISWEVVTLLLGILATIITAIVKFVPQAQRDKTAAEGGGKSAALLADVAVLKTQVAHLEQNFERAYGESRQEMGKFREAIDGMRDAIAILTRHLP